jgi:hypothetical protein
MPWRPHSYRIVPSHDRAHTHGSLETRHGPHRPRPEAVANRKTKEIGNYQKTMPWQRILLPWQPKTSAMARKLNYAPSALNLLDVARLCYHYSP